jgi:Tat protein secretion system quality control protein TatD with DNase activity
MGHLKFFLNSDGINLDFSLNGHVTRTHLRAETDFGVQARSRYFYKGMMLIDSHAHLEMPDFKKDLEAVIQRAKESGVEYIFTVGTEKRDWKRALEIADSHSSVYAILGIHPHNAKEIDDQTYPMLKELCRNEKVKAYGEIGLDFFRNLSPRDIQ